MKKNVKFILGIFILGLLLFISIDACEIKTFFFSYEKRICKISNLNLQFWSTSMVSITGTILAIFGTWYVTNSNAEKQIKFQQEQFDEEKRFQTEQLNAELKNQEELLSKEEKKHNEKVKFDKEMQYRTMNKNNIQAIYNSLEEYYMSVMHTILVNDFVIVMDPVVETDAVEKIKKNLKVQKNYLNKIKDNFYYDEHLLTIVDKELNTIQEIEENYVNSDKDWLGETVIEFDSIDHEAVRKQLSLHSPILEYFGMAYFTASSGLSSNLCKFII